MNERDGGAGGAAKVIDQIAVGDVPVGQVEDDTVDFVVEGNWAGHHIVEDARDLFVENEFSDLISFQQENLVFFHSFSSHPMGVPLFSFKRWELVA